MQVNVYRSSFKMTESKTMTGSGPKTGAILKHRPTHNNQINKTPQAALIIKGVMCVLTSGFLLVFSLICNVTYEQKR